MKAVGVASALFLVTSLTEAGSLTGTIHLSGDARPSPTRVENTTDPEVCGEAQTLEDLLVGEDGGLQNVIVSITGAPEVAVEPETLVLDNVGCRFDPHVAVVTVGSTIVAHNSDTVLHTTHIYGPREWNISLPIHGMRSSRVLTKSGIYSVKCDVHGWMQAFVRVDPHPFHAVTDAEGTFRIDGIPPGTYTLELWHERLGPLRREVTVRAGEPTRIEIEYRQEKTR